MMEITPSLRHEGDSELHPSHIHCEISFGFHCSRAISKQSFCVQEDATRTYYVHRFQRRI